MSLGDERRLFHSVRVDCHLQEESRRARRDMRTTPKPPEYYMLASEMLMSKITKIYNKPSLKSHLLQSSLSELQRI